MKRRTPATGVMTAVVMVLSLGAATACSGDDDPVATADGSTTEPTVSTTATTLADVSYAGLCAALAAAEAEDVDGAARVFDHGPLHELAAKATEIDRATAARLLEAKQQVEAATTDDSTTPETLAADLTTLAEATRQAQRTVGDPVLGSCSEGS